MSKQKLNKWQFIVVSDDSKNEIKKFELDELEKLKDKMKRSKKRSLGLSSLKFNKNGMDIQNTCKILEKKQYKYDIHTQFIFSYHLEVKNALSNNATIDSNNNSDLATTKNSDENTISIIIKEVK